MRTVPTAAVLCGLLTWFPFMSFRYFLNYFQMVPVAPIITGIAFIFEFHLRCVSIVMCLYFNIFAAFFTTFVSPKTAMSINRFFFFIITGYVVRLVVWEVSVRIYLFILSCGYLTFVARFY